METIFPLIFIYIISWLVSLGQNKPNFWKVFMKFLFLAGMLFVAGFVFLIFIDSNTFIAISSATLILWTSLWRAFKW